jgi:hypothetical protein
VNSQRLTMSASRYKPVPYICSADLPVPVPEAGRVRDHPSATHLRRFLPGTLMKAPLRGLTSVFIRNSALHRPHPAQCLSLF